MSFAAPNPGLTFDGTIDAGALLTSLTLLAGFAVWSYKANKDWREKRQALAESGALRLLLKILRERYERHAGPLSLAELQTEFEHPKRKPEREAYCHRNFRFRDAPHFETAIYQLQWEFKIDFAAADKVIFRSTRTDVSLEVPVDRHFVLSTFEESLEDSEISIWDLENLGRLAGQADSRAAEAIMMGALDQASNDPARVRNLLILAEKLRR